MINLKQVKSLIAVAEAGSITRAAGVLYLAPSSVSAQLKELSGEIGVDLFDSYGRGLVLSTAGQQLLPEFRKLLAASEEVVAHAQSLTTEPVGELRLYAPSSMCIYRLPPLIDELQKSAPGVELHLQHDPFDYKQALASRHIEAAIEVSNSRDPTYERVRIKKEEIIFVTHPTISVEKKLSLRELLTLPIITTEPGCSYRTAAEQHCKDHGLQLAPRQSFSNVEVIRRCILAKMGIGLLPRCVVSEDIDRERLIEQPVDGTPYHFYSTLIWPANSHLSPRLRALLEVIKNTHNDL